MYSLLSIGQRGVGKTVFLAGSYAQLHPDRQPKNMPQLWFDCQDSETQKILENVISYVARTGQYPPATLKLTNFEFSLKRYNLGKTDTLCYFRWWDTPGESCKLYNPAFQMMVWQSDGCCVFIDTQVLISKANTQALEEILQPVQSIAEVVYQNGLKHPFALILTKYDLIKSKPNSRQLLEQRLEPLTAYLDKMKVNYKKFYSEIPIVSSPEGVSSFKPKAASEPILWLISELRKAPKTGLVNNLSTPTEPKIRGRSLRQVPKKYVLYLTIALVISSLGAFLTILTLIFKEAVFNSDPYRPEPRPTQQNSTSG
ncbi:MAG TPA: hypothetical protein DDZ80_09455 [Cyanobacteria bacterium UBA8803]|nr:hypothetical protein [Cyanobacteria bacterium UBA9273]HBL58723.1 hypothetical protein [Cyanobacteria bacterium UBA8803]